MSMDEMYEKMRLVKNVVDKITMPGVCGFIVLPHHDSGIEVVVKIDIGWASKLSARYDHIAVGIRKMVKEKLEGYLGFKIYVGSYGVKECD